MRVVVRSRTIERPPHLPRVPAGKHGKYPKENPSQLQPKHPRQLHNRTPRRLAKPSAALLQPLPGLSHLSRCPRRLLPKSHPGSRHLPRSGRRRPTRVRPTHLRRLFCLDARGRIRRRCRIHRRHQRLSRRTSPDTKRTTESNRIHTKSVVVPPRPGKALRINTPYHKPPQSFTASNPSESSVSGRAGIRNEGGQRDEKCNLDGRRILRSGNWFSGIGLQTQASC
jgi:hypothetical protein